MDWRVDGQPGRLDGLADGWTDMPHKVMGEGASQVPGKAGLHTRIEVHTAQKLQFGMVSR